MYIKKCSVPCLQPEEKDRRRFSQQLLLFVSDSSSMWEEQEEEEGEDEEDEDEGLAGQLLSDLIASNKYGRSISTVH